MEMFMKESRRMIRSTGQESTLGSMAEDTKESGYKTKGTVRASKKILTIAATSATLKMTNSTVKECTSGLVAQSTEESFATIREKAKASSRGPMVINTSASILMM